MNARAVVPVLDAAERPWFALRVRSNCEKTAATALELAGYEHFLPSYRSTRQWSDRRKQIDLPLFPGYIFARLGLQHLARVVAFRSVVHVVGAGRTPVPVDDNEIDAIKAVVRSGLPSEPWPFLRVGQQVIIERGPLAGLTGILVEIKKQHRLVISVSMLMRSVAVDVDESWVREAGPPPGHAIAQALRRQVVQISAAGSGRRGEPMCSRKNDEAG